jgi:rhodanese-related sulfurtransferase
MVKVIPFLVLFFLLFVNGCSTGISDKNISFVSPSGVSMLIADGESRLFGPELETVLVDCRETWKFNKAHIPKATNIPFGHMDYQLYKLDDAGIIIIAGDTYSDPVSIAMSKTLMEMGFKNIKTLRGGLKGWEDAGEPVITKE